MKALLLFNLIPADQLVSLAFTVLCAVGSFALHALRKHFKNVAFNALLDQLDKLAAVVVAEVEQTVVEPAKRAAADGKLTADIALLVKEQAVKRLLTLLGDRNSDLRKAFGDVGSMVGSIVESKVLDLRRGSKQVRPVVNAIVEGNPS